MKLASDDFVKSFGVPSERILVNHNLANLFQSKRRYLAELVNLINRYGNIRKIKSINYKRVYFRILMLENCNLVVWRIKT
jgi:hypothetical protein